MANKPTHTGIIRRAGSHCLGNDHQEELRELKNYYVNKWGHKYRKGGGSRMGERFPAWRLDITTIKPIESNDTKTNSQSTSESKS